MVQVTGTAFDLMMMAPTQAHSAGVPECIQISRQAPMTLTPSKSRYCAHHICILYDLSNAGCMVCFRNTSSGNWVFFPIVKLGTGLLKEELNKTCQGENQSVEAISVSRCYVYNAGSEPIGEKKLSTFF